MTTITPLAAATAAAPHPLAVVLISVTVLAVWYASVLAQPIRTCRRCRSTRIARSRLTGWRGPCPKCHANGVTLRLGATTVHRLYWTLRDARNRTTPPSNHATGSRPDAGTAPPAQPQPRHTD